MLLLCSGSVVYVGLGSRGCKQVFVFGVGQWGSGKGIDGRYEPSRRESRTGNLVACRSGVGSSCCSARRVKGSRSVR